MSIVLVGWYLPVAILVIRDPLVRDAVKSACVTGTLGAAKGMLALVRLGGSSLFRNALRALRERRRARLSCLSEG